MTDWIEKAKEIGFDTAAPMDPSKLEAREAVRDMCAADKCKAYGRNWTCPPACGDIAECQEKMRKYEHGLLLQTVGQLSKTIDSKGYAAAMEKHMKQFHKFVEKIREEYPDALCLGAGACMVCKECAYPEPCRFPYKALSSMEAYGLFVTQVCRDNDVKYYYGPKTIAYTGCVLY